MEKITGFITFSLIAILLLCCASQKSGDNNNMKDYGKSKYEKEWKTIDSLENKGLPKSALAEVEKLYTKVKEKKETNTIWRCLVYKSKYLSQLEEDGFYQALALLEKERESATFPLRPLLETSLAELYKRDLQANYWQMKDRTELANTKENTDIQTWTASQYLQKIQSLYLASLKHPESVNLNIKDFNEITSAGQNTDQLRPTLYDFLANRAISYFSSGQSFVAEPVNNFIFNQEEAFLEAEQFVNYSFKTQNENAGIYQALLIFQDLMKKHLSDKDKTALIDTDIKRIKFANQQNTHPEKSKRYLKALLQMSESYKDSEGLSEVYYLIASYYKNSGASYQPNPENKGKDDLAKALSYCEKGIKAYPQSYGADFCKSLKAEILNKSLELQIEDVNVAESPFMAYLSYKNLEKVWLRIIPIDEKNAKKLDNTEYDKVIPFLASIDPVKEWSVDLPEDKDYNRHAVEIKLDALPFGNYIVLVSDNEGFSWEKNATGYAHTTISNLSYFQKTVAGKGYDFYVTDRTTGLPVPNASIHYYKQNRDNDRGAWDWKKQGTLTTDENGFGRLLGSDRTTFKIIVEKGQDLLDVNNAIRTYGPGSKNKRVTTNFFLDRKIYRPGQTVFFKGMLIEFDEDRYPRILPNEKLTVDFLDANYQVVFKKEFTTNEYGTINGSFTAPRVGLLGSMQLRASRGGAVQFRVEEYKRPKFEVQFDPVKESYKLNDLVSVNGFAKAYAGSNIDGAKVKYRVVRTISYPYFYWRRWSSWRPVRTSAEIANGSTTTNEEGKFTIEFPAKPDEGTNPKHQPQFNYQVSVDVTDITGETHSKTFNVSVGYIALNLGVDLQETIDRSESMSFEISSLNLNGQFEPATGTYKIEQLKSPATTFRKRLWNVPDKQLYTKEQFKEYFPKDPFLGEEKMENWAVQKTVVQNNFATAENKTVQLDQSKLPVGYYSLTINSKDKFGAPVELKQYFQIYDTQTRKIAENNPMMVKTDKQSYEVGDLAKIFIGTSFENQKVLFKLDRHNENLTTKWINVNEFAAEEIKILEKYRGNLTYSISFVRDSRPYETSGSIIVPWSNKELSVEYTTFRDKLLPGQEERWQVKIMGSKKERVAAELVAAMYDASLDAFAPNNWNLNLFPTNYSNDVFRAVGFGSKSARIFARDWNDGHQIQFYRNYRSLNWFNFYDSGSYGRGQLYEAYMSAYSAAPPAAMSRESQTISAEKIRSLPKRKINSVAATTAGVSSMKDSDNDGVSSPPEDQLETNFDEVNVRTNLNETVFFLPELKTDTDGNVIIEFTMNEALTKWKFLLMAHTKDLKTVLSQKEVLTQKELMVMPNAPRFFREGDIIEFTAKVSNLSENTMNGVAKLELLDALTNQPVDQLLGNDQAEIPFSAAAGQSAPLSWKLKIPEGKVQAIVHRVVAKTTNTVGPKFSDGEEDGLPILINRMLVTESMTLPVRGNQTKTFDFKRMADLSASPTLQSHRLTLEYTSNPAWYAVQALPYLMEYPYDCTEQIFNRFYANSLATTVANAHPKVKAVFDAWKDSDALMSNLSKNQELKAAILEETPWVMDAQNEAQQKKNIGLLFDLTKMAEEQEIAAKKIVDRQANDGGFSWFPGGRSSHYITQYLVEGLGHLNELGVNFSDKNDVFASMLPKAIRYIDKEITEDYIWLKRNSKDLDKDHLSNIQIHYLYARSFFLTEPLAGKAKEAHDYYLGQAKKYWVDKGQYQQGMIGLAVHRLEKSSVVPKEIIKSLQERALQNEELGMYWKTPRGYYWYQHPIETQALMIEAFREIAGDAKSVEEMRIWLLKNKQTSNWKTTKATAAAVYSLLIDDKQSTVGGWLLEDAPLQVTVGNLEIKPAKEDLQAGTGYYKTNWRGSEIKPSMSKIKIKNDNDVIAWGGLYWQYFEQLDKITTFEETPLQIKKEVFKETNSDRGPILNALADGAVLNPGDKLKVRIEIRVDRDMEYVHMKDMRGSGFEPMNVLSRYKYQGGLGYYESTRDVSTNFFMDYLPKGTYVFEYPLRVVHKGDFSNGITSIQCMYAPEFSSHSEGIRLTVE